MEGLTIPLQEINEYLVLREKILSLEMQEH
jgi:hypothetical protein